MKHLLILALSVALFSCQRNNNSTGNNSTNRTTGSYFIKFKANGTPIEYTGDLFIGLTNGVSGNRVIVNTGGLSYRQLIINGQNGSNNIVSISIVTDSVKTGQTYVINNTSTNGVAMVNTGGKQYQTYTSTTTPQYSATVTITQHSGGWISGTFTGKLGRMVSSNPLTFEDLTVTDGTFETKVVY